MKHYQHLPQLDEFQAFAPTAKPFSRSCASSHEPAETLTRGQLITGWVCRIVAAAIMIETLFFKFTGAPESVYIFTRMGLESWWRYGQGVWELIAAVLLLSPRLGWAGGILTLGAMGAALVSHVTILGIVIQGDHGLLFGMAVVTFACGFIVTFLHRHEIPSYTPTTPS